MPKITRHTSPKVTKDKILAEFFAESRRIFGEQYRITGMPSVLIARAALEYSVEQGVVPPENAIESLRNSNTFASILLDEEFRYKKREDQKIHSRMGKLERNTHIGYAIGISVVTGLTFCLAGPFASTWLQPTVDHLLKRDQSGATQTPAQTQPITNNYITNNYGTNSVYNFPLPNSAPVSPQPAPESKPQYKVTCRNETLESYKGSLLELLQSGNIVTLETNGKKVSLCYRPHQQRAAQLKALTK